MATHTIYTYDDFGKFTGERTLELSAPHPKRFTDIAPTREDGKIPVFNFTNWVNVPLSYYEPTLDKLKSDKIAQLRLDFNNKIEGVKSDNAAYEIDTWTTQNAEWTSYVQNVNNPTPYVDALAAARGIDKATLMTKIGLKVVGIATLQGTQHGIEDQIKAAADKETLNAITWNQL